MNAVSDEQLERFFRLGWLVLPRVFSDTEIDAVRGEIEGLWTRQRDEWQARHRRLDPGHAIVARPELARLHRDSERLASFCFHSTLATIAGRVIGPDVDLVWNQAHVKGGGGHVRGITPWHQDDAYIHLDAPLTFTCWVALTPATRENGAMWGLLRDPERAPRPHHWDPDTEHFTCDVDDEDAEPILVERGQVVLFDSRFCHRSPPNLTAEARIGYSFIFSRPGARLRKTGERFGDRLPVVRGGRPVAEVMRELARHTGDGFAGRHVVAELEREMPEHAADIAALVERMRHSTAEGDGDEAERALCRLLCLSPREVVVQGLALSLRTSVDAILREVDRLTDPAHEGDVRLLLGQALRVAPGHPEATRRLALLDRAA